jgi:hypothetical protein
MMHFEDHWLRKSPIVDHKGQLCDRQTLLKRRGDPQTIQSAAFGGRTLEEIAK